MAFFYSSLLFLSAHLSHPAHIFTHFHIHVIIPVTQYTPNSWFFPIFCTSRHTQNCAHRPIFPMTFYYLSIAWIFLIQCSIQLFISPRAPHTQPPLIHHHWHYLPLLLCLCSIAYCPDSHTENMAPSPPPPFVAIHQTYHCKRFTSTDHYSMALFACTNEANNSLVHCNRHPSILPASFSTSRNHPWCVLLFCDSCNLYWSVCSTCLNVRTRMLKKKQCNRHQAKYHSIKNTADELHPFPPTATDPIPHIQSS